MRRLLIIGLVVAAAIAGSVVLLANRSGYTVNVVLPSATNVVRGGVVTVNGFQSGTVQDVSAKDGKASLVLALDDGVAPLHDGAVVRITWKALLGERWIAITDGRKGNAEVPEGGMIPGKMPTPMEYDQVLDALDAPTRKHLVSLIDGLDRTVKGDNGSNFNKTVRTAGPALQALGEVMRGLGVDGPAIRQLVSQTDAMVGTLANRDKTISTIVQQLSDAAGHTARQKTALSQALRKLPGTVRQARGTLGAVPGTVRDTTPLLDALKPATDKLPEVAKNLRPVLQDLRPMVARLRPTLNSASQLLDYTPGLLDTAHATLPGANTALRGALPALDYLRPYTPELVGLVSNWGSAGGNYDANGHYERVYIQGGAANLDANPGIVPPGHQSDPHPAPGSLVGQPWTDAYGNGMR